MDESFTLMLNVRAGKTSAERKPKVEGDGLGSRNGAVGETGRENAGKPCWFSSFRGEPDDTAELRDTPDKKEKGGSRRG